MEEITISKLQRHLNLSFVKAKKLYDCYQSELTERKARSTVEAGVMLQKPQECI